MIRSHQGPPPRTRADSVRKEHRDELPPWLFANGLLPDVVKWGITITSLEMVTLAVAHRLIRPRQRTVAGFRRAHVILGLVVLGFCAFNSIPRSEEANTAAIGYSEEQARKGHDLYDVHCASCHGAALEGQGSLPLSGATFRVRWADDRHSVDDLFYIIRTLMPYGQPATLSKQDYLDIIAYILMVNGYPAGAQPLPLDPRILKQITIKAQQP